jgi:hypothetical protein
VQASIYVCEQQTGYIFTVLKGHPYKSLCETDMIQIFEYKFIACWLMTRRVSRISQSDAYRVASLVFL